MAHGGPRPNSGRPAGAKNKATLEREAEAERMLAAARALEDPRVQEAVGNTEAVRAAGKKNGKDILEDFSNLFAGMAAFYQPAPPGHPANTNADEVKFRMYAQLAMYGAEKVAQYQSPKLSAVMLGATRIAKIKIEGGLPDLDQLPAPLDLVANQQPEPVPVDAPPISQPVGAK